MPFTRPNAHAQKLMLNRLFMSLFTPTSNRLLKRLFDTVFEKSFTKGQDDEIASPVKEKAKCLSYFWKYTTNDWRPNPEKSSNLDVCMPSKVTWALCHLAWLCSIVLYSPHTPIWSKKLDSVPWIHQEAGMLSRGDSEENPTDATMVYILQQSCLYSTQMELHPFTMYHPEVEISAPS